jgi:hypothetical protein
MGQIGRMDGYRQTRTCTDVHGRARTEAIRYLRFEISEVRKVVACCSLLVQENSKKTGEEHGQDAHAT